MNDDAEFAAMRQHMVADIAAKAIFACARLDRAALGRRVMAALAEVPRHEFVPRALREYAYADTPLPIGSGKTISQPFIVGVMTDLLDLRANDRVLEIGTGLGYQTAILAALALRVYSVELIGRLAERAHARLARLGVTNVEMRVGNGVHGWAEEAPFDKILVAAAPATVPRALVEQLRPGGRLVLPSGPPEDQQLIVLDKDGAGAVTTRKIFGVRFSLLEDTEPR